MSSSILDAVVGALTPDFLEKAAAELGEAGPAVKKGMGAAAPLLLGTLTDRTDDSNLMSTVFDLIRSPDNDPNLLGNPSGLLGKAALGLPAMMLGGKLLSSLFGNKKDDVGRSLGGYAGVGAKSGSSLLGLAAPLLLGALGKIVRSQNLNLGSLIKLLLTGKDEVHRAIPGPLRQLGLGGVSRGREVRDVPVVVEKKSSMWRWLGPLLIALLGLWLLSKLFGGGDEQEAIPAPALEVEEIEVEELEVVEAEPVEPVKPVAPVEPVKVEEPEPVELEEPEPVKEAEAEPEPIKLEEPEPVRLEEPAAAATTKTVTTTTETVKAKEADDDTIRLGEPDKHTIAGVPTADIYFAADSDGVPTGVGRATLDDVIAYMKAHPESTAKIAGYHATTGDLDHNKDLAHRRAAAVQTAMKKAGIAKDRTSLVEPLSTQGSTVDKYARRVEVTVEP